MARPYSLDLRDRVVASVEGGRSCRETARLFGGSVASVVNNASGERAVLRPHRWVGGTGRCGWRVSGSGC